MLRVIELVRDLHHLRAALAGPMGVDPQDRRELEGEIRELEAGLQALQQGWPEYIRLLGVRALDQV